MKALCILEVKTWNSPSIVCQSRGERGNTKEIKFA